jgi:hypothetical protein
MPLEIQNHSGIPLETIEKLPPLLSIDNGFAGRYIVLYEHPHSARRILSVATDYKSTQKVIHDDKRSVWNIEFVREGIGAQCPSCPCRERNGFAG